MKKTGNLEFADNSFDYIRLFAALAILWYHLNEFIPLSTDPSSLYNHISRYIGSTCQGVAILFTISGFLIPPSFERSRSAMSFLKKRILRIYPGLIVSFLATFAFIMTVYRPELDLKKIAVWFGTQLTVMQSYTPGFLRGYGSGTPNGSLWTIFTEIQMYVLVALFYRYLKKLRLRGWITLITCGVVANVLCSCLQSYVPHIVYRLMFVSFIPYFYIFAIGMFLYFYRDTIVRSLVHRARFVVFAYAIFSVFAYFFIPKIGFYSPLYMGLLLPFVVVTVAYALGRHRLPFDISYGIYLYHLIFVNLLIELGVASHLLALVIVVPASIAAGFASYYLVEKPVQKLLGKK